ncbi:hypothetical protein VTN49DRAFT_5733 [Thermomyces lanuginosus]|uniref:uncharacterized protein n=1 Tax=Thermomyces lanuginosus TaxID=5541 RepID=UPI003744843C
MNLIPPIACLRPSAGQICARTTRPTEPFAIRWSHLFTFANESSSRDIVKKIVHVFALRQQFRPPFAAQAAFVSRPAETVQHTIKILWLRKPTGLPSSVTVDNLLQPASLASLKL